MQSTILPMADAQKLRGKMPEMSSLESALRNLIIRLNQETARIINQMDNSHKVSDYPKLAKRRDYLSRLQSECLLTIGKEIDFFKNN